MSNPALFHHLNGYQIYPGTSNEKYTILPFKSPDQVEKPSIFYSECSNKITFLVLSTKTEENESNRMRLIQFPFEFYFLIFPVTAYPGSQQQPKDMGFNYVGPITFVPGKRNVFIFLAVLGNSDQDDHQNPIQTDIYLFVVNAPEFKPSDFSNLKKHKLLETKEKSDYLKNFIEINNQTKFNKILKCIQPTKKYNCNRHDIIRNILFMSDGRHFLISTKHEVFMYHIENEHNAQLKVQLPQFTTILNCDYRNDTLLCIVQDKENKSCKHEVMFFNLQDRPTFILNKSKEGNTPSFSIYIKEPIFFMHEYPGINLIFKQKGNNANNDNSPTYFNYIHNTKNDDSDFYISGCKFLPGDNDFISLIVFDSTFKKLHVYFFKLKHPPLDTTVLAYDIYQMNSVDIIEYSELSDDIFNFIYYPTDPNKDCFDFIGNDDEFEFTFMLYSQILVRFHYNEKRIPSVQVINTKGYRENMRAIMVPDQQPDYDNVYKYLPASFQSKSEQYKYFQKEASTKTKFNWLKLLGPKATSMPSIFQIESTPYSGFKNFATYDTMPENRDK